MEKDKNMRKNIKKMIIRKPISKPQEQSTHRIELYFTVKLLGGTVINLHIGMTMGRVRDGSPHPNPAPFIKNNSHSCPV